MIKIWQASSEGYTMGGVDVSEWPEVDYLGQASLKGMLPEKTTLLITRASTPGDYVLGGPFAISGEIKSIFESADARVEYFELNAKWRGKPYTKKRYYFAHILEFVDCIDYSKSDLVRDSEGVVSEIGRLVIDEAKASGYSLFRLANVWGEIICVSQQLADRIEAEGLRGIKFVPPAAL